VRRQATNGGKRGIVVSARIPSYLYGTASCYRGDYPEFLSALRTWAQNGWVDRVMVCTCDLRKLSLKRYMEALVGTRTALWGDLYQGTWSEPSGSPGKDFAIARKWVKEGMNGGVFYYMRARPTEWEHVNWQMRLIDFPGVKAALWDRFE
jgi:hypothetical protein